MTSRSDSRRELPAWFLWIWLGLVVVAALLELTVPTSYQRVILAAILLVALLVGGATFRSFGVQRGPLPQRAQKLTPAVFVIPVLCLVICYLGRFAVAAPGSDSRSNFGAGFAGLFAGAAVAHPLSAWMWRSVYRRRDRRNTGNRSV